MPKFTNCLSSEAGYMDTKLSLSLRGTLCFWRVWIGGSTLSSVWSSNGRWKCLWVCHSSCLCHSPVLHGDHLCHHGCEGPADVTGPRGLLCVLPLPASSRNFSVLSVLERTLLHHWRLCGFLEDHCHFSEKIVGVLLNKALLYKYV